MKSETRYKIIKELAPYFSPKEIRETFDIGYQSIYHYCDKYNIDKYTFAKQQRNKHWKQKQEQQEIVERRLRLQRARDAMENNGSG